MATRDVSADAALETRILAAIRAGHRRLFAIRAEVGCTDREGDRALQRLRRRGLIRMQNRLGWVAYDEKGR